MAITLNQTRNAARAGSSNNGKNYCRSTLVTIHNDGKVDVEGGTVDLGYHNDHYATLLEFDRWRLTGINFDNYEQILVFQYKKDNKFETQSFQFTGQYFFVPSEITTVLNGTSNVDFSIIYTLQEKQYEYDYDKEHEDEDLVDANLGNVSEHKEIFISATFRGILKPSFLSIYNTSWDDKGEVDLITANPENFHKDAIAYTWAGAFGNQVLSFGQYRDSLITPLSFTNFPFAGGTFKGLYEVYFYFKSNSSKAYKYSINIEEINSNPFTIWVPREITNDGLGQWNVGITYEYSEGEGDEKVCIRRICSDSVIGTVESNFLVLEDLSEDKVQSNIESQLIDSELNIILDQDNNELTTIEATGQAIPLNYTRDQVNTAIGWVSSNGANILSRLSDANYSLWMGYDGRILDVERKVEASNIDEWEKFATQVQQNTAHLNTQTTLIQNNKTDIQTINTWKKQIGDWETQTQTLTELVNSHSTLLTTLSNNINQAQSTITSISISVLANTTSIEGLQTTTTALQTKIKEAENKITTTSNLVGNKDNLNGTGYSSITQGLASLHDDVQGITTSQSLVKWTEPAGEGVSGKVQFIQLVKDEVTYESLSKDGNYNNTLFLILEEEDTDEEGGES